MTSAAKTIDYKKELEAASKGMIMIHDPELLIKLIVRMIVQKVHIKHAGMVMYDPAHDRYVLSISRGERGIKIPADFIRFDKNHSLIKLFTKEEYKSFIQKKDAILAQDVNKLIWQESVFQNGVNPMKDVLYEVSDQMRMFNAVACVPVFYRNKLLALFLLGEKNDGTRFEKDELDFLVALASDVAMALRNAQLFEALKNQSQKNHDLFIRTAMALGSAIEAKDKYTHGHTERVTSYSLAIARQMVINGSADFDSNFFENLYIASMLHDIGKIGVPESILNKTGKLTEEELVIMRRHTVYGVEILRPLSELKESLDGVKYHHERYDGLGYPDGLKGDNIPMIAAIITVADTFDAMVTDRPYRKGLSKDAAVEEIKKNITKQFHPKPAQAFLELLERGRV